MSLRLKPTFAQRLGGSERPLVGMWVCSVSPVMAEIAAGSGLDWVMIDAEHSPQSLLDMQNQLQAMAAYPVTPVVRMPIGDPTLIKQVLDLGPQNIIVPMVSTAEQAEQIVRAATYPPTGIRGVGSSSPLNGSSIRIISASASIALAIATRRRIPPLRFLTGTESLSASPSCVR